MQPVDIVFCSVPFSDMDHIYSAPAILKGVAQENGYTAKTVEFGCNLLSLCNKDSHKFHLIQKYFISPADATSEQQIIIDQFYLEVVQYFLDNPSTYIGISAISTYSHRAVIEICARIKQAGITSQIIIGGRGGAVPVWKIFTEKFRLTQMQKSMSLGQYLHYAKLAEYHVVGDGEDALLSILNGTHGSTELPQHSDHFRSPIPDYSDYKFESYLLTQEQMYWPITGSKGCVRDCDFCDVKKHFGKYRYRGGADIAHEMITISQQTGTRKFQFNDSLVNGGLKPFQEFLEIMANYNSTNPDQQIKWSGQYICRPETPERIYKLISAAGGEGLTIGAESGSNRVLAAMNKKTTVEALYAELEQFKKHNITTVLLFMVGHWSETWEDFVEHCKALTKIAPYIRSGTISAIQVGTSMGIIDHTPVFENREKNNLVLSDFDPNKIWVCKDNPTNTVAERIRRQLLAMKIATHLNFPMINQFENYVHSLTALEQDHEQINRFYQQFA